MTTQLMNFNIPKGLKADLDRIAQHRNVSRTAIIITLIEGYCRNEWKEIEEAMQMQRRVEDASVWQLTTAHGTMIRSRRCQCSTMMLTGREAMRLRPTVGCEAPAAYGTSISQWTFTVILDCVLGPISGVAEATYRMC
jgi:hypothetical protein